jgi:hypothetical protein
MTFWIWGTGLLSRTVGRRNDPHNVPREQLFSETKWTTSWILRRTDKEISVKISVVSEKGGSDERVQGLYGMPD